MMVFITRTDFSTTYSIANLTNSPSQSRETGSLIDIESVYGYLCNLNEIPNLDINQT